MEGRGVSLADAERIVEANLTKIIEKLCETCQANCSGSQISSAGLSDTALGVHTHSAVIVRSSEGEGDAQREKDFGGDMNHIHRVSLQLLCHVDGNKECLKAVATVIVKTAPDEVLYLKEESGERVSLDQKKVELEYRSLIEFDSIQPKSVPVVYLLDRTNKSIVMEDLSPAGFVKLQDVLTSGNIDSHLEAIESALAFIGKVHRTTRMGNDEREELLDNYGNTAMRQLMANLLFDRPFTSDELSNTHNSLLSEDVEQLRGDQEILKQVAKLKTAFLCQNDCLCHGDLATDNVMVNGEQFRIIDLEFSGIGLCAYDLALFLEMTLFRVFCSHHGGQTSRSKRLYNSMKRAAEAYERGVGREAARNPTFVEQTCGLIALEMMWMVFGSYHIVEFAGDPVPERAMLSLSKDLLLKVDSQQTVTWNIAHHLELNKMLLDIL